MDLIRIATRKSPLALWQARQVAKLIGDASPATSTEIIAMNTEGDLRQDAKLAKLGGKGLFLKELQMSLLDDQADIAVHSMKDVPAFLPEGLDIVSVIERADPRDAFVSNSFSCLDELPKRAVVGTSSSRRKAQLLHYRPDLQIHDLRGNLTTRLDKLDSGNYDAIILACAGLDRLDNKIRIRERIENKLLLPAIGQGIIGVECLSDNYSCRNVLATINHMKSWICLLGERSCGARLEADCHMPIAVYADLVAKSQIEIVARVCDLQGTVILEEKIRGRFTEVTKLGGQLADTLLERGARQLLNS